MVDSTSSPSPYEVKLHPEVDPGALEVLQPLDYGTVLHSEAAFFLDGQMRLLAAGRAVLDLQAGRLLGRLLEGGHDALGYPRLEDYCREKLGFGKRTAKELATRAKGLEARPVLRGALVRGEINGCQASLLLRFLKHDARDAEWAHRARGLTVRGLQEVLKAAEVEGELGPVEGAEGTPGPEAAEGIQPPLAAGGSAAEDGPGPASPDDGPVPGEWWTFELPARHLVTWAMTRELLNRVAGEDQSPAQALEYLYAELLSGAPPGDYEPRDDSDQRAWKEQRRREMERIRADCELVHHCWEFFDWRPVEARLAPELCEEPADHPHRLHAQLEKVLLCRDRLGLHLGRMLRTFHNLNLARKAEFASVQHYAQERLGLSSSTTSQLLARERNFLQHLEIRQAVEDGRLTVTRADLLMDLDPGERREARWVEFAGTVTCRHLSEVVELYKNLRALQSCWPMRPPDRDVTLAELRRKVLEAREKREADLEEALAEDLAEAAKELAAALQTLSGEAIPAAQGSPDGAPALQTFSTPAALVRETQALAMRRRLLLDHCETKHALRIFVPDDLRPVIRAGESAARAMYGGDLTREECLIVAMEHFAETWSEADRQTRASRRRVLERDGYRCAVPTCTCRRIHEHHVEFRSRGGGDEEANRVSTCPAHHLRHVHDGRMRITGTAPDALRFELGIVNGEPFEVYEGPYRVLPEAVSTATRLSCPLVAMEPDAVSTPSCQVVKLSIPPG